jgi:hypothetical protein
MSIIIGRSTLLTSIVLAGLFVWGGLVSPVPFKEGPVSSFIAAGLTLLVGFCIWFVIVPDSHGKRELKKKSTVLDYVAVLFMTAYALLMMFFKPMIFKSMPFPIWLFIIAVSVVFLAWPADKVLNKMKSKF